MRSHIQCARARERVCERARERERVRESESERARERERERATATAREREREYPVRSHIPHPAGVAHHGTCSGFALCGPGLPTREDYASNSVPLVAEVDALRWRYGTEWQVPTWTRSGRVTAQRCRVGNHEILPKWKWCRVAARRAKKRPLNLTP